MSLMIILLVALILIVAGILFYLHFNQDPKRIIPKGNTIVSPADGRIIEIIKLDNKKGKRTVKKGKNGLFGRIRTLTEDTVKTGYLISIFMTPFNVHIQRAPLAGEVIKTEHSKGKFLNASTLAALENEKNEIIIKTKIGKVKVIQIAGFVARRIECWVKKKQNLLKGEKLGRINLGSQVILIVPDVRIKAKIGDKVKAGETVLAEY